MLFLLFFSLFKRQLLIFLHLVVNFFRNRTVLDVCDFSLGALTEKLESPLV